MMVVIVAILSFIPNHIRRHSESLRLFNRLIAHLVKVCTQPADDIEYCSFKLTHIYIIY